MIPVTISSALKSKVPGMMLSCIEADVTIKENDVDLWERIRRKCEEIAGSVKIEEISRLPAVAASRQGYKSCGKDPARYRLSAEALLRRIIHGKELYQVNNVVDLLNLVSISTGYSIGGYDADKIEGTIILDIGKPNEPYHGIGRGELNIDSLPVFRDQRGAFGTPTSDSIRTAVSSSTHRFLMVIVDFGAPGLLDEATAMAIALLREYAGTKEPQVWKV